MQDVVPVRFKYNAKTYWFAYHDCQPHKGDWVLVARDNGKMFGWVEDEPFTATEEQISQLKSPLSSILGIADESDLELKESLEEQGREAKKVFRELAEKRNLPIKPIDVEYLIGGNEAIFHFSSEDRVDFRELVRDLAARLHVHVDMKQIGVRDEARLIGGLGHCGEILCCDRITGAFQPVSIRMAKDQDLPLNPTKVSGACGRLMCCLRYESDAYKDYKQRAPKVGTIVETPAGNAKVVELNTPRELVRLKMEESGETFFVPLAEMDQEQLNEQGKPHILGTEAFEAHCPSSMKRTASFEVPADELLDAPQSSKQQKSRRKKGGDAKKKGEGGQGQAQERPASEGAASGNGESKSKRRRQRKRPASNGGGEAREQKQAQGPSQQKQRPGQNSSGIRNPQGGGNRPEGEAKPKSGNASRRRKRGGGWQGQQGAKRPQGQEGGAHASEGAKRTPRRTSTGSQRQGRGEQ